MKKALAIILMLAMVFSMVGCAGNSDKGSVYYLNFKPEADAAWQALAEEYTKATGVEVKVVTAAAGTYSETLTAEMDKSAMPTLFQCGNYAALKTWQDYCYDLSSSAIYNELTNKDYTLKGSNGEVYGIGYCVESYGIITNKALLAKAGYEVSDITDFASLKAVAEDITARSAELGFAAFTSAGLDGSSSWRFSGHLTNMPLYYEFRDNNINGQPATVTGQYLDNYKQIWDLYVNNSTCAPAELTTKTGDESEAEFGEGKAVFFQNGTWEFNNLTTKFNMNPDDLVMIPIYCGVEGEADSGLCTGSENFWVVNSKCSEADIQATLDFLEWVVTNESGTKMMAEQFGVCPFNKAVASTNVFSAQAVEYVANGKYPVTWAFTETPNVDNWRAGVVAALTQYTVGGGSWDDVVSAFVNGWATEYNNQ